MHTLVFCKIFERQNFKMYYLGSHARVIKLKQKTRESYKYFKIQASSCLVQKREEWDWKGHIKSPGVLFNSDRRFMGMFYSL